MLPPHLRDYIIVHELCHLVHLHHGKAFWDLVAEQMPEWRSHVRELRAIDKLGHSVAVLKLIEERYQAHATELEKLSFDAETTLQPSHESCVCNEV